MRILHLSDIHFGSRISNGLAKSTHHFVTGNRPEPKVLGGLIRRDNSEKKPDLIVISGDLGWSGCEEDYDLALQFLVELEECAPRTNIVLAPGNHDVDIKDGVNYDDRQLCYEKMVRKFYKGQLPEVYPALTSHNVDLQARERLIAIHETDLALTVSVNSSAWQDGGSTPIVISPQVLQFLEDRLSTLDSEDERLRVFVLHHHLFPFVEMGWEDQIDARDVVDKPDSTMLANAARVQHWLTRNRFDVVLHGHKHTHHGREDRLWRPMASEHQRRMVIVGAGSAGVSDEQRARSEPLSYNTIDIARTARSAWNVHVEARQIDEGRAPIAAVTWAQYTAMAGSTGQEYTTTFSARRMDDCHANIAKQLTTVGLVRNFRSVVEDSTYIHPPTAKIEGQTPDIDRVERCFRSLHPEYSSTLKWDDENLIDEALQHRRERLEHGSRIFRKSSNGVSPIGAAIRLIDERESWAYIGLYRPTLDTDDHPRPMPGLMSIQFIPDPSENRLDAVATFRNLELSFWWVVNMLEMRRLLEYAADRCRRRRQPGSVTMFAALAEWKRHPDPVNAAHLDELELADLIAMAISVRDNQNGAAEELAQLLDEKFEVTSRYNTELIGLRNVIGALGATQKLPRRGGRVARDLRSVISELEEAKRKLTFSDSSKSAGDRQDRVAAARIALQRASHHLRTIQIKQR